MRISVTALEMPEVRLKDHPRASIFTFRKLNYLQNVVHILFVMKGVLLNDLEPMLERSVHGKATEISANKAAFVRR